MTKDAKKVAASPAAADDKEQKRRKQLKRMTKVLATAWQESDPCFQEEDKGKNSNSDSVLSLAAIGSKLDNKEYRAGKHGWEDFCRDLGSVYNYHIIKRSKHANLAKQTLDKILPLLPTDWLQEIAIKHDPCAASASSRSPGASSSKSRKRTHQDAQDGSPLHHEVKKMPHSPSGGAARKKNKTRELADREDRAMEQLKSFVLERGGAARLVEGFNCRVTKKGANSYNVNFYNAEGRRFRSMLEVGRHFGLVVNDDTYTRGGGGNTHSLRRKAASKESEAEKKRLRRELDRLRKVLKTASKALDAHASSGKGNNGIVSDLDTSLGDSGNGDGEDNMESEPIDDYLLADYDKVTRFTSAAARIPDIDGFPLVPPNCVPDVLMVWDFLCKFSRALSLTPIALDDFAAALVYTPPEGQLGDDVASPPVFLAEAHIGLLKLLLQDAYSDDWWWSTLETIDEEMPTELLEADADVKPVIKVDMEALLSEKEDPLITASWYKCLESSVMNGKVGATTTRRSELKAAIKSALGIVSNKWVHAYLRKILDVCKSIDDPKFVAQAVVFLVRSIGEARPDLKDRSARSEKLQKAKERVIAETNEQMAILAASTPAVSIEDALSDVEYDSEDSDDEDDEEAAKTSSNQINGTDSKHETDIEKVASVIPPRPSPTIVDLLLPPTKPTASCEYLNSFTWSAIVGATAHRILHRKKRLLNEVDDYLRAQHELKPPSVSDRRERERVAASRVLSECEEYVDGQSPTEKAIEHLCRGDHYLLLSTTERLCLLRLMIEAAYDTTRVFEVVNGNIKQRQNAMKALEVEQRRAKKEEKEKAIADVAAARERLAVEAKERFLDEKREEIRKLNEKSKELSDDIIESLTEEDIVEFDEDIKADFMALPGPESFTKAEVLEMVNRIQEEAAFDCDSLRVMKIDELLERERRQLEEMEGQFIGFGGDEVLEDPSLDRETVRSIERLKRDIEKAKEQAGKLPLLRERAIEQLKDAMEDGTIKVLRGAITAGKKAKLSGPDEETGGLWVVDLLRDAALELDRAKANKRVIDAQRDLILKRNKCFIRTEPMGTDRFGNRFWTFDSDEDGHFWVEAEYCLEELTAAYTPDPGFVDLRRSGHLISYGVGDFEEDLVDAQANEIVADFCLFSRREHHSNGFTPSLVKRNWGCQATENSLRAVLKILNSKGLKEGALKSKLKESLEHIVGNDERLENTDATGPIEDNGLENMEPALNHLEPEGVEQVSGDFDAFKAVREGAISQGQGDETELFQFDGSTIQSIDSAIGQMVRVRLVVDGGIKDQLVARYENGTVVGWKTSKEGMGMIEGAEDEADGEAMSLPKTESRDNPEWKVATERGHTVWLQGEALLQSISRYERWKQGKGYFEDDAAFFAYRNQLGKYLGRPQDAPYSCCPNALATLMLKREGEFYAKLKNRSYDNNWGGKSGARALWTNSMKDYAFDFSTVKEGLITLESAFFELTGEFSEYKETSLEEPDVKALLENPTSRHDIELETIEKNVSGLWNSKASRLVFIEIVASSKTTAILALCLDLLCRNTLSYLRRHKLLNTKADELLIAENYDFWEESSGSRRTRGMNLWQRQKKTVNYEEFF